MALPSGVFVPRDLRNRERVGHHVEASVVVEVGNRDGVAPPDFGNVVRAEADGPGARLRVGGHRADRDDEREAS